MRLATRHLSAVVCAALSVVAACEDEQTSSSHAGPEKAEAAGSEKARASGDAKPEAATAQNPTIFTKEHRKQRCEGYTPEFVAKTFEFDVAKLEEQRPKEGKRRCNYQWEEGEVFFFANVGTMWVKKDVDGAIQHYANATASKTQAEIEADMAKIKKEVAKKEELDTAAGKKVTNVATKGFAGLTEEGVTYEPVDGIGDEAKVSSRDGTVWVRIGNAHLIFSAYKGPKKPPLMDNGRPVADIDAIMAHEREWIQGTTDQRRDASLKLARAWVPELVKLVK